MKTTTHRFLGRALAVLLAAAAAGATSLGQATPAPAEADAAAVVLHVTVAAGRGAYASGVEKSSFVVYDDKVPRGITLFQDGGVPASVCIVLDTTQALSLSSPEGQNAALEGVVKGLSHFSRLGGLGNEYAVVGFGDAPRLLVDWTRDLSAVGSALSSLKLKGWKPALYDGCFLGLDTLARAAHRKRVLVVVSGGGDSKSRRNFGELHRTIRATDVLVYTVGVHDANFNNPDEQWRSELSRLAAPTGGALALPFSLWTVEDTFKTLAHELERQYLIGFEPAGNARDGKRHRVEVKLAPVGNTRQELKGLRVRSREEYVAAAR